MNTQKNLEKKSHTTFSGSLVATLSGIIVAVVFMFPASSWSQDAEWTIYNTSNSGMPYNGATVLAFDEQGSVWVGTGRFFAVAGGGLAKFDGESWTVYNSANSPLPHNDHTGLAVDPEGNVWAGTEGGLAKFDRENWTIYKANNSGLTVNLVATPIFDNQGNLWVGSWGGGLYKFDGSNWTVYNRSNSGLHHNTPWALAFDSSKNLWIGTAGGGLAKFDGTNWTIYNRSNSPLPDNNTYSIDFDSRENLWIATDGGGLAKFDGVNWTVYNTANSGLPSNRIWTVVVDAYDNVWIGTYDRGLVMFDGSEWTVYNTSNSDLPDNTINYLAIDDSGDVWIATQSGGIAVYHPEERAPIIDFNGDGIVNAADIRIMIDRWLTNDPLCDIAPPLTGDGIVDVQDLILLSEHLFEQVYDPTLIAHWALDETEGTTARNDVNGDDDFVLGGALWRPEGGVLGGALELDGIDDCVISGVGLNSADGPFSVFAWIKGGLPGQVIISQPGGVNWLEAESDSGCMMTELTPPALGRFIPEPLRSESVITDGQWHRIGFVWNGTNRSLYVDDILVAEDTQDSIQGSNSGLYIGVGKDYATGTFYSGLIDDVRVYNRAVNP